MAVIYIVEDDRNILEIETFALKNAGYEVEGFRNGALFGAAMERRIPALVILDIMLPDADGLSILRNLRARTATKDLPVIMVTAKTTELDKVKGLDSGADDYMTKPFGVMELISRVKALLRRMPEPQQEHFLEYNGIRMDVSKRSVKVAGKSCELTYKEFELLKLFLSNVGIVISRDRILDKIWGTDYEGESRTIDMHVKNLRQKLGEEGKSIKTIRNVGYVMDGV